MNFFEIDGVYVDLDLVKIIGIGYQDNNDTESVNKSHKKIVVFVESNDTGHKYDLHCCDYHSPSTAMELAKEAIYNLKKNENY